MLILNPSTFHPRLTPTTLLDLLKNFPPIDGIHLVTSDSVLIHITATLPRKNIMALLDAANETYLAANPDHKVKQDDHRTAPPILSLVVSDQVFPTKHCPRPRGPRNANSARLQNQRRHQYSSPTPPPSVAYLCLPSVPPFTPAADIHCMLDTLEIPQSDREGAVWGVSAGPISSSALRLPYRFYLPLNSKKVAHLVSSCHHLLPLTMAPASSITTHCGAFTPPLTPPVPNSPDPPTRQHSATTPTSSTSSAPVPTTSASDLSPPLPPSNSDQQWQVVGGPMRPSNTSAPEPSNVGTPSSSTNPYSLPTDDEGSDDEDFPEDQESKQEEEMPPASSTVKDRRGAPVGPHTMPHDDDAETLQMYYNLTAEEYAAYMPPVPMTTPTGTTAAASNQLSATPAVPPAATSSLLATATRQQDEDDQTPSDSGYTTPTHPNTSDQELEEENVDEQPKVAESKSLGRQKRAFSPQKNDADSPQKSVPKPAKTPKQNHLLNYFPASSTV